MIEAKGFDAHDGTGFSLARLGGLKTGIITKRISETVALRARDLKIEHVYQGQQDKAAAFYEILKKEGLTPEQVCYVGDDVIDLPVMRLCGLAIAVKNARPEVLRESHYVTPHEGGHGAVRDAIEYVLARAGFAGAGDGGVHPLKSRRSRRSAESEPHVQAGRKIPSEGQGRIALRRGSRFYTTILRVVSRVKHTTFGEVSLAGKKLSEFDKTQPKPVDAILRLNCESAGSFQSGTEHLDCAQIAPILPGNQPCYGCRAVESVISNQVGN